MHDKPVHSERIGEEKKCQDTEENNVKDVDHMRGEKRVDLYLLGHHRTMKEKYQNRHKNAYNKKRSQLPEF
jgi:hypothetical protein